MSLLMGEGGGGCWTRRPLKTLTIKVFYDFMALPTEESQYTDGRQPEFRSVLQTEEEFEPLSLTFQELLSLSDDT